MCPKARVPALAAWLIGDNAACLELGVIWAAGTHEAVREERPGAIHGAWSHPWSLNVQCDPVRKVT